MRRVVWSKHAHDDFRGIIGYIAQDDPAAARPAAARPTACLGQRALLEPKPGDRAIAEVAIDTLQEQRLHMLKTGRLPGPHPKGEEPVHAPVPAGEGQLHGMAERRALRPDDAGPVDDQAALGEAAVPQGLAGHVRETHGQRLRPAGAPLLGWFRHGSRLSDDR